MGVRKVNAAIGYSSSSDEIHPSIYGSWWNLKKGTKPREFLQFRGKRDTDSGISWGSYPDMTIDPVDDCSFWYVNEYVGEKDNSPSASTRKFVSDSSVQMKSDFFVLATGAGNEAQRAC